MAFKNLERENENLKSCIAAEVNNNQENLYVLGIERFQDECLCRELRNGCQRKEQHETNTMPQISENSCNQQDVCESKPTDIEMSLMRLESQSKNDHEKIFKLECENQIDREKISAMESQRQIDGEKLHHLQIQVRDITYHLGLWYDKNDMTTRKRIGGIHRTDDFDQHSALSRGKRAVEHLMREFKENHLNRTASYGDGKYSSCKVQHNEDVTERNQNN